MITEQMILKFGKDILKRFEHNLNGGTMILFNVLTYDVWFGNSSTQDLFRLINGERTIESIHHHLVEQYKEYPEDAVIEIFDNIILELLDKRFLEVCINE